MRFLTLMATAMLALVTTSCAGSSATAEPGSASNLRRPNIIYILADDLGYGDIGPYGQSKIMTPTLDRLSAEGIRFTDHYAGSTVCAPSRGSLLTGLHTGHSRVRGNPTWTKGGKPVDLQAGDVLISEMLKDAGYRTAVIGKWGLAEERNDAALADNPAMPLQQGFDYFFGYKHHGDAHHYYWDTLYENNSVFKLESNDYRTNTGQYTHDLFAQKALDYIEQNSEDEPFFLYLALTIPHLALTVPEDSKLPYQKLGWPKRKMNTRGHYKNDPEGNTAYAGMVSRMDRDIGRILALLDEKGIAENTIVIFTSDNGPTYDKDKFFNSNGPLRGGKRDLYEGGIRVPMIARWPGTIAAGSESSHVSAFWDVMPTVCDLAGESDCPEGDGISFLPALTGNESGQASHEYLYWEFNEQQGPIQAVRMQNWKLVRFLSKPAELYDLSTDIGEMNDVANQHPEIVAAMTRMLKEARSEHPEFVLEWHKKARLQ